MTRSGAKRACVPHGGKAARTRPSLGDERGMLLVITMIILLVLSAVAAASLVNSHLERSLARSRHFATIAQNAAEAGVTMGLAWLNDAATSAVVGDPVTQPGWTKQLSGSFQLSDQIGGLDEQRSVTYTTTLQFKREGEDGHCDNDPLPPNNCNNEVVYYNNCAVDNCFGYPQSAYHTPAPVGHPVIQIVSEGKYGAGALRRVILEVARDKYDIKATGAVTSASDVDVSGGIIIDGRSHDADGNLGGTCDESFTGVSVPPPLEDHNGDGICNCSNGVTDGDNDCSDAGEVGPLDQGCTKTIKDGSSTLAGSVGGSASPWTTTNVSPPLTPDEALGLENGDLQKMFDNNLPASGATKTVGKITYVNQDYDLSAGGTGILIVHNPYFDSLKWSWSDPNGPYYQTFLAGKSCSQRLEVSGGNPVYPSYDPCLDLDPACAASCTAALLTAANPPAVDQSAYRAARQPRNMSQNGNLTFKGLIIADKIDRINGNALIIGGVITLAMSTTGKLGNGSAQILYSCDAISEFADQGYRIKLGWRRVID